ncbi:MAG: VOC family protein [Agriterribacter sp.]
MKIIFPLLFIVPVFVCTKTFAQAPKARINHVAIYVMDVKKSGDFYMNIIGLDSIPEPFHDGKHIWLRIGPGASMHIIEGASAKKEYYKNNHTCFTVASVQAFTEILKKHAIPWEDVNGKKMGITNRVDGVKQIWLQDPDGYWLEINDAKD